MAAPPPVPLARSLRGVALVASVLLVVLVAVLASTRPTTPLPLAPNVPATVNPPPMDIGIAPGTAPSPAPAATATSASSAAPLSVIPNAGGRVELVVVTTPAGATVWRDGQLLGLAPGPFSVEGGSAAIPIEVRAAGYQPLVIQVLPKTGATVRAVLKKGAIGNR